jgi:hypothetical protein
MSLRKIREERKEKRGKREEERGKRWGIKNTIIKNLFGPDPQIRGKQL